MDEAREIGLEEALAAYGDAGRMEPEEPRDLSPEEAAAVYAGPGDED